MRLAIIGGTGIDEMEAFTSGHVMSVETRFGFTDVIEAPDALILPRHGLKHSFPPERINYRAQIAALKQLGVDTVIGVCAVGSLRIDLPAGSFAVLSDFIDLTKRRLSTFFDSEEGPVVHTDFTHPYCPSVSYALARACECVGVYCDPQAVYVGVDGPRYETPTEIRLYASWGGDVVGMTNLPEAVLAREAGLCYGALAVVTNLASSLSPTRLSHEDVRLKMAATSDKLNKILIAAIRGIPEARDCACRNNNCLII